jgi:hypothetical protein
MNVLLVTFRLQDRTKVYDDLFSAIEHYPNARVSSTTYLIHTDDSPSDVYSELRPFISTPMDTLIILSVSWPWHGRGPNELLDWMLQRCG